MGFASLYPSYVSAGCEIAKPFWIVIVREGGRSSIPETAVIESTSRGVLDPRLRGDDSGVWAAYFPFSAAIFSIRFASTAQ
jgi:hypothetical protein